MENKLSQETVEKCVSSCTLEDLLSEAKSAVESLDAAALTSCLTDAQIALSLPHFLTDYVAPLLRYVGEQWYSGHLDIAHERVLSSALKTALWGRMSVGPWDDSRMRAIAIATLYPDKHEMGSMMVACSAAMAGWKPIFLGSNIRVDEVIETVSSERITAVAISSILPGIANSLVSDLEELMRRLAGEVTVFVGGNGSRKISHHFKHPRLIPLNTLDELRAELNSIHLT